MKPAFAGFLIALACVAASLPLCSQTMPGRDAQAVQVIQSSLAAMGGEAVFAGIRDATAQGTVQPADAAQTASQFTWFTSGREFRVEITQAGVQTVLTSNRGTGVVLAGKRRARLAAHFRSANRPFYLPGLVLEQELADGHWSIATAGVETLAGTAVVHLRLDDSAGKAPPGRLRQDWYFDAASHLPVRVEFQLPISGGWEHEALQFSAFASASGMLTPMSLAFFQQGTLSARDTITQIEVNTHPASALFELPWAGKGGAQ